MTMYIWKTLHEEKIELLNKNQKFVLWFRFLKQLWKVLEKEAINFFLAFWMIDLISLAQKVFVSFIFFDFN